MNPEEKCGTSRWVFYSAHFSPPRDILDNSDKRVGVNIVKRKKPSHGVENHIFLSLGECCRSEGILLGGLIVTAEENVLDYTDNTGKSIEPFHEQKWGCFTTPTCFSLVNVTAVRKIVYWIRGVFSIRLRAKQRVVNFELATKLPGQFSSQLPLAEVHVRLRTSQGRCSQEEVHTRYDVI